MVRMFPEITVVAFSSVSFGTYLVGLEAFDSLLLLLLSEDDEGSSVLVEC